MANITEVQFFLDRGHERGIESHCVTVHVNGKCRRRASLHKLFLCQYEGEWRYSPPAVLLRGGHRGVANLLKPSNVLEGKTALAVVLLSLRSEFFGEVFRKRDNPFLF